MYGGKYEQFNTYAYIFKGSELFEKPESPPQSEGNKTQHEISTPVWTDTQYETVEQ